MACEQAIPVPHAPSPGPVARIIAWRRAWLGIDHNPATLRLAQTIRGNGLLHLAFFALLWGAGLGHILLALSIGTLILCAIFPSRRIQLIGATGMLSLVIQPYRFKEFPELSARLFAKAGFDAISPALLSSAVAALFLLLCWSMLKLQAESRGNIVGQRPFLAQVILLFGLLGAGASGLCSPVATAFLWAFIGVFATNFWTLGYAFANLRSKAPAPALTHVGFLRPVWNGNMVPVGKGIAFLRKFEAKDDEALAATRLKALKLIVWALILQRLDWHLGDLLESRWGIPDLRHALLAQGGAMKLGAGMSWLVLLSHYFLKVVEVAATGHVVVATVRMAGFAIPRNSVSPFASRTIAEFWNRYFYYFKELLVDFFFFPAFTRFFKKNTKIRIAFATFCAASIGNCIFHLMNEIVWIPEKGLRHVIQGFESYLLYSLILASGIIISQLRNHRPKPEDGFLRYQLLPRIGVTLFFCIAIVFDDTRPGIALSDRFSFILGLTGF